MSATIRMIKEKEKDSTLLLLEPYMSVNGTKTCPMERDSWSVKIINILDHG